MVFICFRYFTALRLKIVKMPQRWPQVCPRRPQDGPKRRQDGPKTAPRRPQDDPKTAPRRLHVVSYRALKIAYLRLGDDNSRKGSQEAPKRPPEAPRRPQRAPQSFPRGPPKPPKRLSRTILEPSSRHLGAIFAHPYNVAKKNRSLQKPTKNY